MLSIVINTTPSVSAKSEIDTLSNVDNEIINEIKIDDKIEINLDDLDDSIELNITDSNGELLVDENIETISVDPNQRLNFNAPTKFAHTSSLTASNPQDMYFFTTTSNTFPMIKITSDNPNYIAQLYQYDASQGMAYPIQFYDIANDDAYSYATSLPAYNFIWVVYSLNGTVGSDYTIMANVTNDANPYSILRVSDDLADVTLVNSSKNLTINNAKVSYPNPSNVKWERNFYLSTYYGYINESQSLSSLSYDNISGIYYGKYDSTNYKTDNAVFYQIKIDSFDLNSQVYPLWSYSYSQYFNGQYLNRTSIDIAGQTTPRRLNIFDAIDFSYVGYNSELDKIKDNKTYYFALVYDLNTGTVIDFASKLNGYYNENVATSNLEYINEIKYEYILY